MVTEVPVGRTLPAPRLDAPLQPSWHRRGPPRAKSQAEGGRKSPEASGVLRQMLEELERGHGNGSIGSNCPACFLKSWTERLCRRRRFWKEAVARCQSLPKKRRRCKPLARQAPLCSFRSPAGKRQRPLAPGQPHQPEQPPRHP
ncbi:uncharacterized protein WM294_008235 [Sarcoramphus papa]